MVRVSVILPVYNGAEFVEEAINSVLAQTMPDFELIVVDDGSTDHTCQIVSRLADRDHRIKLHSYGENHGLSYALNFGTRVATGEWVAVIDADDLFSRERLDVLLKATAEYADVDVVADNLIRHDYAKKLDIDLVLPESILPSTKILSLKDFFAASIKEYLAHNFGFVQPMILRQFLLQNGITYDEGLRTSMDFFFYGYLLLSEARFLVLKEPYYVYRLRSNSLVRTVDTDAHRSLSEANRKFLAAARQKNVDPETCALIIRYGQVIDEHFRYYAFVDPLKSGEYGKAFASLVKDLGSIPLVTSRMCRVLLRRIKQQRAA